MQVKVNEVRLFIDEHPEFVKTETNQILESLTAGFRKRNKLSELHQLVKQIGLDGKLPFSLNDQGALVDWLVQFHQIIRRILIIRERGIKQGVMVSTDYMHDPGSYCVKGFSVDFYVYLKGRSGAWNPVGLTVTRK